jgi:hypothetical protein
MDDQPPQELPEPAALGAIARQPGASVREKLPQWLSRYGVAECAGVACALVASLAARAATKNAIAAAYAGAWGETIGYAGVIITRDFWAEARGARAVRQRLTVRRGMRVLFSLLAEFGPAGLLDTLVTRPFAMGVGARLLGPVLGLVAGKLAADALFYVPVIFMYERRKLRDRRNH